MRVVSKKALSGTIKVTILAAGIDQTISAKVIWSKKISFRVYEIGMAFTDRQSVKQLMHWIAMWAGKSNAA